MTEKLSSWWAVWQAMRSWRTAAVSLLSFSSGLPLGLVWIAIPTWLARVGVDIKIIGLFTLAQAPWSFKFLWSPLLDRYGLPGLRIGQKLGWTLFWQVGLLITTLVLGGVAAHPESIWMIGTLTLAIAFASASQDIAIDAYAVEVLRPEEQGVAVGARTALYRTAMFISGGVAITLAGLWSWSAVFALLALLYLPLMVVTFCAPRPESYASRGPASLRAAVWEPFVSFLTRSRALEILAFVVLYKLADNLAGALVRPFLVHVGFNDFDVGIATATIGLLATLVGTLLGGVLTTAMGLGHALWAFGILQIVSNLGYVFIADLGVNRPLMYGAMAFESLTSGMGTGAFGVLLLRMTQKQFSATQYALFSSLFALPRILAGPVTGVTVAAIGWHDFFILTMIIGIPGMVMLQRFSPLGVRNPDIEILASAHGTPVTRRTLMVHALLGGAGGAAVAALTAALLEALKHLHAAPQDRFDFWTPLIGLFSPQAINDWVELISILLFGVLMALTAAATAAARARNR
jgi:PAT family beta-lactamase induction signal transducer AmpG